MRDQPLTFHDANVLRFGDPTDLGEFGLTAAQIDALIDELPLPRARDMRITIRAEADDDPAYWAAGRARRQAHADHGASRIRTTSGD